MSALGYGGTSVAKDDAAAKCPPRELRDDITMDEVKQHDKENDCWMVIGGMRFSVDKVVRACLCVERCSRPSARKPSCLLRHQPTSPEN